MEKTSYGQILKSSSITGGSQVIAYAAGLLRTKIAAVILGPSGIGLIGIYTAVVNIVAIVSTLGLRNSGVREIAVARGMGNSELVGEIHLAIRRLAIGLSVVCSLVLACLSPWISQWLFGAGHGTVPIALLGWAILFKGINVSQIAIIQGHRRIGALAKISIGSAVLSTITSIIVYYFFGEDGIAPVLILVALASVVLALFYSQDLRSRPRDLSWSKSSLHWRRLIAVGSSVAWGNLVAECVPFYAKALIIRELGIDYNGLYVAAWVISGMFANFVLQAMSADYFPRLSESVSDRGRMSRLVDEQTEVGILIALPGVVAAFAFAPLVLPLFYTAEFSGAAALMKWFLIGVMARVINWPMGMIMLANGHARIFAITQTASVAIHLVWITFLFERFSLEGAAMAFGIHNIVYGVVMRGFLMFYYEYRYSKSVEKLILATLSVLCIAAFLRYVESSVIYYALSSTLVAGVGLFALKSILGRVEDSPAVARIVRRLPNPIKRLILKTRE